MKTFYEKESIKLRKRIVDLKDKKLTFREIASLLGLNSAQAARYHYLKAINTNKN